MVGVEWSNPAFRNRTLKPRPQSSTRPRKPSAFKKMWTSILTGSSPIDVTYEPAKPTMAEQLNRHKTAPWVRMKPETNVF